MGVNMNKIDTLYEKMDVISSKVEEMVYAINDMKEKWTILKGWYGCQSGQGDILEQGVLEKDVSKKIKKYSIGEENIMSSPFYCSFCGKGEEEVEEMLIGPEVTICNDCVRICVDEIMANRKRKEDANQRRIIFNELWGTDV